MTTSDDYKIKKAFELDRFIETRKVIMEIFR
jgi:hypothetical protein